MHTNTTYHLNSNFRAALPHRSVLRSLHEKTVRYCRSLFTYEHILLVLPLLIYNCIMLRYVNFFPLWDSRAYWGHLYEAVTNGFKLENFAFGGHPSYAYGLIFAASQYAFGLGNIYALNGTTLVLGNAAILAFRSIIRSLFPEDSADLIFLKTVIFASHPAILANSINFNLDTGILFFWLFLLFFLFQKRTIFAMLSGFILVFTKEVGIVIFIATTVAYCTCFVCPTFILQRTHWRTLLNKWPLLLPIFSFAAYFCIKQYVYNQNPYWSGAPGLGGLIRILLNIDPFDPAFVSTIADVFILNFMWIGSTCILIVVLQVILHKRCNCCSEAKDNRIRAGILMIVLILLVSIYATSRIHTPNNIRYWLVLYPMALIIIYASIQSIVGNRSLAIASLAMFCCLNQLSLYWVLDPVSKHLFGTIPFGENLLLTPGTLMPWGSSGIPRDDLVYNLQFVEFGKVQDQIYEWIRPTDSTYIVASRHDTWMGFDEDLDAHTFHRSVATPHTIRPQYTDASGILSMNHPPHELFYIHYPNIRDANEFSTLFNHYTIIEEQEIGANPGYHIRVSRLTLK